MPRYFAPISPENLSARCRATLCEPADDAGFAWSPRRIKKSLAGDLKVRFDFENFAASAADGGPPALMGPVMLGHGLVFWGMCSGGDWETPVFWIVYFDGRKLRAYIPTDGNCWNTATHAAYGNDDEADLAELKRRFPGLYRHENAESFDCHGVDFDAGLLLNDIVSRLLPRPE